MHEATLAGNLFRLARRALADAGCPDTPVKTVHVRAGALAGVMPDALRFAFDALKRGTNFAEAQMRIHTQPVEGVCGDCGREYAPAGVPCRCPACGGPSFSILRGEDVIIESLEI